MGTPIGSYIRQHHVGLLALFLVVTGGTAYALDGSNTVFTDDIVNGEVRAADIGDDEVTGAELAAGSVASQHVIADSLTGADVVNTGSLRSQEISGLTGSDIVNGSLRGVDVEDDSITGADVAEGTLGQVPSAAIGGIGRYVGGNTCDPGANYHTCAFVSIDLPSPSRVLVNAVANARGTSSSDVHGTCRLATHLAPISGSTLPILVENGSLVNGAGEVMALTAITDLLPAGGVDVGIQCIQQEGDIWFSHVQVSAVALSPN